MNEHMDDMTDFEVFEFLADVAVERIRGAALTDPSATAWCLRIEQARRGLFDAVQAESTLHALLNNAKPQAREGV